MLDDLKKGLFASIGAVLLTRDKAERVIEKFVKDSKLDREEGRKLVDDLVSAGERQWSDVEAKILETVKKAIGSLDVARQSDLEHLRERVYNLEQRMTLMEETSNTIGKE